jgi:hypothetical protein
VESVENWLKGTCVVLGGQDGVVDRDVQPFCLGDGGADRAVFGPFKALGMGLDRRVLGGPVMDDGRSDVNAAA